MLRFSAANRGHFHGRGAFQVTLAHAHEANQRIVEQLNDQVDFLNRQLANREAKLSEVRAGIRTNQPISNRGNRVGLTR